MQVASKAAAEEQIESEDLLMNAQITIFDTHPELWQGHGLVARAFSGVAERRKRRFKRRGVENSEAT